MVSKSLLFGLGFATTVFADFYLGSISGEGISGSVGAGPAQQAQCNYILWDDGTDICDAGNSNPEDGSGGCPGQNSEAPDWCGMDVGGIGCPSGYVIGTPGGNDDCGAAMNDNGGETPSAGTFYANVIDTSHNNTAVGRCVYELSGTTDCVSNGSYLAETLVHCYMKTGC